MIDISALPLLKGKKALVTGIANDQSIAWGCAKAFQDVRCRPRHYLSERQGKALCRASGQGSRGLDLHAAQHSGRGPDGGGVQGDREAMGQARHLPPLHRVRAQSRPAGARGGLLEGRLSPRHGCVLLVVHPHGKARRAADEGRRHALHHDLLWVADGGGELQHDGPGEGCSRSLRSLSRGRTWAERHQGACHFARAAQDPRGVRHHRFR